MNYHVYIQGLSNIQSVMKYTISIWSPLRFRRGILIMRICFVLVINEATQNQWNILVIWIKAMDQAEHVIKFL